jgi:hypothetical protein
MTAGDGSPVTPPSAGTPGYGGQPSPTPGGGWVPVPDPTTLTTSQLRRELASLRELLESRLDAMDRATKLLDETVNRTPTIIQTEIAHLRELMAEKLSSTGGKAEERFSSIDLQFTERDIRTSQAAAASAQALAAALQAAKEAVFEQAQAAAKAAEKTEMSTTKQIDLIQNQIRTLGDTFGDKIDDLKGRIDRGEGSTSGAFESRSEQRLNVNTLLQVLAVIAAAIIVFAAFHK